MDEPRVSTEGKVNVAEHPAESGYTTIQLYDRETGEPLRQHRVPDWRVEDELLFWRDYGEWRRQNK